MSETELKIHAQPVDESFNNEPLTFSIPTHNEEWISFTQIKDGAMRAANERLRALAPACEKCDWYIHSVEFSAEPTDSFYTLNKDGVEHKLPLV